MQLRAAVELEPVDREWAENFVAALFDAFDALEFRDGAPLDPRTGVAADGMQLTGAAKIAKGVRVRSRATRPDHTDEIDVVEWSRRDGVRLDFLEVSEQSSLLTQLALISPAELCRLELAGVLRGDGDSVRANSKWNAVARLDRWWNAHAHAVVGTGRMRYGHARITVQRIDDTAPKWRVEVHTRISLVWWLKPVAVFVPIVGAPIRKQYRKTLEELAQSWNHAATYAARTQPTDAASSLLESAMRQATATATKPSAG